MSQDEIKGIVVNPRNVSFALSLLALAGILYQFTGYVLARDYRMDSIENNLTRQEQRFEKQEKLNEKMSDQIEKLSENILRLTLALENRNRSIGKN